jgi:hypothetical protein
MLRMDFHRSAFQDVGQVSVLPDTCHCPPVAKLASNDECPAGPWNGKEQGDMESTFLVLFWTGPIGIGVFLAGLGVLFWGISQFRQKKS